MATRWYTVQAGTFRPWPAPPAQDDKLDQRRFTLLPSIHPFSSEAFRSTDDKAMCHPIHFSRVHLLRPCAQPLKILRPPLASPGWVTEPKRRVSSCQGWRGGGFTGSPGDGERRTQQPQPLLHHHGSLAAWSPSLDMPGFEYPWPFLESNSSITPNCGHCRPALSVSSYQQGCCLSWPSLRIPL